MNKMDAATCSAGAYVQRFIHVYNAALYTYCVYILCMHLCKMRLCQDHKISTLIK